jgi:hypothetical protein
VAIRVSTLVADGTVEIAVELGVGRSALEGVWDSAVWGTNVWGQSDTSLGDWVDFTCDVVDESLSTTSGTDQTDGVVTHWAAATCSLRLLGPAWDPWHGPYAGLAGPGLPVRIRWRPATGMAALAGIADDEEDLDASGWQFAFVGAVDDEGYNWNPQTDPARSYAALAATDGTRILSAFDGLEQNPQGAQETASQRVTRILDTALWSATLRDITAGGVAVQATTLADNAWTMLLQVADTDLALLWIRRDGYVCYRPLGRIKSMVAVDATIAVCPADSSQIQMVDMEGGQPTVTRNIVSISRQARDETDTPVTITRTDDESVARFLPHTYQRTDLIHWDDDWSGVIADAVLAGSAWPRDAPQSVELNSRVDPRAAQLLLGLDFDHRLTITDGVSAWQVAPSAFSDVQINRREITGVIALLDMSAWASGAWDTAKWDIDQWGYI